ncbi:cupredoxin domain-containing protein [Roseobacter sp.]|uniref:cupredoxin domain-containing protein n=1 Tax=Roseobacter sp. TaxID=1907202 RepID=UPI003297B81F
MNTPLTRRRVLVGAVASATALAALNTRPAIADSTVHEVRIKSFTFEPTTIQAKIGDTIRWTNEDLAPHTATADELGWDTEELVKGASGAVVVTDGMETSYFCIFHPHMKGSIEILES